MPAVRLYGVLFYPRLAALGSRHTAHIARADLIKGL